MDDERGLDLLLISSSVIKHWETDFLVMGYVWICGHRFHVYIHLIRLSMFVPCIYGYAPFSISKSRDICSGSY